MENYTILFWSFPKSESNDRVSLSNSSQISGHHIEHLNLVLSLSTVNCLCTATVSECKITNEDWLRIYSACFFFVYYVLFCFSFSLLFMYCVNYWSDWAVYLLGGAKYQTLPSCLCSPNQCKPLPVWVCQDQGLCEIIFNNIWWLKRLLNIYNQCKRKNKQYYLAFLKIRSHLLKWLELYGAKI